MRRFRFKFRLKKPVSSLQEGGHKTARLGQSTAVSYRRRVVTHHHSHTGLSSPSETQTHSGVVSLLGGIRRKLRTVRRTFSADASGSRKRVSVLNLRQQQADLLRQRMQEVQVRTLKQVAEYQSSFVRLCFGSEEGIRVSVTEGSQQSEQDSGQQRQNKGRQDQERTSASKAKTYSGFTLGLLLLLGVSYLEYQKYQIRVFRKLMPEANVDELEAVSGITASQLTSFSSLAGLDDSTLVQIGIGFKPGFDGLLPGSIKSPVSHSSILLSLNTVGRVIVAIGRQSQKGLFNTISTSVYSFTANIGQGLTKASKLFHQEALTEIDCEKQHLDDGEYQGTLALSVPLYMVRNAIESANRNICHQQLCEMQTSNCYSASIYMLSDILLQLDAATEIPKDNVDACIRQLHHLIHDSVAHHHGFGVFNNDTVVSKLDKVRETLIRRELATAEELDAELLECTDMHRDIHFAWAFH